MKKLFTFLLLIPFLSWGQTTVVYNIPIGQLVNQGDFCGSGNLYNNCAGAYGFTWTSTGTVTPTSVTVEMYQGIDCAPTSTPAITLNGAAEGTITNGGQCTCTPSAFNLITKNMTPSNYVVGGTNTVSINDPGNCAGFSPNGAWGGAYARVTVVYPQTCISITPDVASLPTVTGQCSATVTKPTATAIYSNTYTIPVGQLVNQGDFCGTGNLYNNCAGAYGFTWTSTGAGTPTSVTVEMYQGIDCAAGSTPAITLNGAAEGTITNGGQCTCTPSAFNLITKNMTPSNYVVGGTNTVSINDPGNCAGFSPNGAWGGAYARVIVVYSSTVIATTSNPLTYTSQGSNTVTWTYTDPCGNSVTQAQSVVVNDVTAPVADVASLTTVTAECSATVTAPTATDNCVGSITGTTSDPLTYSSEGSYTITWTYDDGNGNTSTQTQNVVIDDVTAPVADVASLTTVTAECSATVTAPTATDNCVGSITGTTSDPLTYSSEGSYTITWTYDDGNGNTSTQTQSVVIDDVTAPVADVASLADVDGCNEVTSLTAPTATDNCLGSITGTTTTTFPITATTVVAWTYDDGNGNTSTQTQNVNITTVDINVTQTGKTLSADEVTSGVTYQWVDCDNANAAISGETYQSFTPAISGNYAVEITLNGCTVTSSCFMVDPLGVETNNSISISVLPNPNNGEFTIKLDGVNQTTNLKLFDVNGKLIKDFGTQTSNNQIDVSGIESGVYLLGITSLNTSKVTRVVVLK